jgi:23S rRNA (uracil1939-C5)-methyltransferase
MSEECELRIDGLAAGGDGVGRDAAGRVVFVPLCAPGDRVRVRLVEERPRFARGELIEVIEPGPSRVAPRCSVFGVCGGCTWQHVSYAEQCKWKQRILGDALRRIARLDGPEPDFVASSEGYGYRTRARLLVEGGELGFRRASSRAVCATGDCPVLVPELNAALAELFAGPTLADGPLEIGVGGDRVVSQFRSGKKRPAEQGPIEPGGPIPLAAGPDTLRVSPGVFFQAHHLLRDVLADAVLEAAGEGERALELYAGAGFFSLRLARRFERLIAVEASRAALDDLRRNLAAADLEVRTRRADATRWIGGRESRRFAPEVVVLDPPRAGLGEAAAKQLAGLTARRIVYLSCDPATLARDLRVLVAEGYTPSGITGFDLFPQTAHIEALAVLDR